MLDINIAKDISNVAAEARHKANYLRLRPAPDKRNYEQEQEGSDVLEEFATKLDNLLIKYFIYYDLFKDADKLRSFEQVVSRQCKAAIRREKARASLR